jgi:uroporphyrin-III C-methyltransferase
MKEQGSLVVVGTGIKAIAHMTAEAMAAIRHADRVLYGVCEPVTEKWIRENARSAECLDRFYVEGEPRMHAYHAMVDEILRHVREGLHVCVAFEGHPGVFVHASHAAIRQAREEGYRAWMLPGVPTQSVLFCDLLIDPAEFGSQTFDATDFLLRGYEPDVTSILVLWQVGSIGDTTFNPRSTSARNVQVLAEVLGRHYGPEHEVVAYQAPVLAVGAPGIRRLPLNRLGEVDLGAATLFVPPLRQAAFDMELGAEFGVMDDDE